MTNNEKILSFMHAWKPDHEAMRKAREACLNNGRKKIQKSKPAPKKKKEERSIAQINRDINEWKQSFKTGDSF